MQQSPPAQLQNWLQRGRREVHAMYTSGALGSALRGSPHGSQSAVRPPADSPSRSASSTAGLGSRRELPPQQLREERALFAAAAAAIASASALVPPPPQLGTPTPPHAQGQQQRLPQNPQDAESDGTAAAADVHGQPREPIACRLPCEVEPLADSLAGNRGFPAPVEDARAGKCGGTWRLPVAGASGIRGPANFPLPEAAAPLTAKRRTAAAAAPVRAASSASAGGAGGGGRHQGGGEKGGAGPEGGGGPEAAPHGRTRRVSSAGLAARAARPRRPAPEPEAPAEGFAALAQAPPPR